MANPVCSIIIPVYNVENYLRGCLDSVLSIERIGDCEIIIVNDGSTDFSAKILEEYAQKHDSIRVIHQENAGLAGARNTGLDAARGKYIYFVDSDDYVNKEFVAETLAILQKNEQTDLLQYRLEYVNENNKSLGKTLGPATSIANIDVQTYGRLRYFQPYSWSWVYSKEFLDRFNLRFDPSIRIAEDADFILRCFFEGPKITTYNKVLYYYRQRPHSLMGTIKDYSQNFYHLEIARKLIRKFYSESGSEFPEFIKKRIYKLVLIYLKNLASSKPNKETICIARQDFKEFKETVKACPGCILKRPSLRMASLSLYWYVKLRNWQ